MVNSVGRAYAILRGRQTGDVESAQGFLDSLSPVERVMRNRNESRLRRKARRRERRIPDRVRRY